MNRLDQIRQDWDDLAEIDAAWFHVPSERISNRNWDCKEFFKSGKSHIKGELSLINQVGIPLTKGIQRYAQCQVCSNKGNLAI